MEKGWRPEVVAPFSESENASVHVAGQLIFVYNTYKTRPFL